jgi:hypothetical protein
MREKIEELVKRLKKKQKRCYDSGPIYNSHIRGAFQDGKSAAFDNCIVLLENMLKEER